jgi:hypothetical protein
LLYFLTPPPAPDGGYGGGFQAPMVGGNRDVKPGDWLCPGCGNNNFGKRAPTPFAPAFDNHPVCVCVCVSIVPTFLLASGARALSLSRSLSRSAARRNECNRCGTHKDTSAAVVGGDNPHLGGHIDGVVAVHAIPGALAAGGGYGGGEFDSN